MQKRCCNCFALYEDLDGMCPHCGYSEGEPAKEIYYLVPGTVLKSGAGKEYIIGEAVGSGGFGIIYKAWDKNLERKVAIKEYFPSEMVTRSVGEQQVAVFSNKREAEYKKGLNNFLQEATIMSLCADCDNVCNSYDKFEANGTAYMVMEFLNGKTLKAYVKEKKGTPLKESEILSYIIQTLTGLNEIHKRGVVHLDIAPDNIYVMPDGKIKIADFGAAKSKKVKKDESEVVLKPGFAPPEQYRANAKVGPEADIYAVGANLYWLLTGQVPLEATDRDNEDVMEEPAMLAMVSPALNNVTMRAMAVKTELRYKNAQEFIADLRKENVRSLEEELKRRKRKRRNFLLALVVTLMAVIASVGYFGFLKNKIWEDSIVVWVVAEGNTEAEERRRYREIIEMFQEAYPQIEVTVVVKDSETIEREFKDASKKERPDLVEVTEFSNSGVKEMEDVSEILERNRENLLPVLEDEVRAGKKIPTGCYVNVIYAESDKKLSELKKASDLSEFIAQKTGFCMSDSRYYLTVQKEVAGRYQLMESPEKYLYVAEEFSVYARSGNKKKAATVFLEYLLTDAVQDILHVQHQSGYMPVAENAWEAFIDVYSEFLYLENSIKRYDVK